MCVSPHSAKNNKNIEGSIRGFLLAAVALAQCRNPGHCDRETALTTGSVKPVENTRQTHRVPFIIIAHSFHKSAP